MSQKLRVITVGRSLIADNYFASVTLLSKVCLTSYVLNYCQFLMFGAIRTSPLTMSTTKKIVSIFCLSVSSRYNARVMLAIRFQLKTGSGATTQIRKLKSLEPGVNDRDRR